MKSNIAIPICKVCMKDMRDDNIGTLINGDCGICYKCFRSLNPHIQHFKLNGINGMFLYEYTESAKGLIYAYKGCFDYELHSVFLLKQKNYLTQNSRKWVIVPAPSYKDKDKKRGFNHVTSIFEDLGLPILEAVTKTKDVKQADLSKEERANIYKYLKWNNNIDIKGKNVLFVDDILTTGSTASAICKMIKEHGANKVEILIGFHTMKDEKLSLFERIKRSFIAYDLS